MGYTRFLDIPDGIKIQSMVIIMAFWAFITGTIPMLAGIRARAGDNNKALVPT